MKKTQYFKGLVAAIVTALLIALIGPSAISANTLEPNDVATALNLDPVSDKETLEYLENVDMRVIQDNKNVRIVESTENGKTTIAVLNKKKNTLTFQVKGDKSTKQEIDLNELAELEASLDSSDDLFSIAASTLKEDTFSNYEYTITFTSPESWQLRRPNPDNVFKYYYKNVKKTSTNKDNLAAFKKAVDNLNYYEWMYLGSSGGVAIMTVVTLIVAAMSGGAGIAALLFTAGVTGAAYTYALKMSGAANNAHYYYFQVR
ncbi:geobacillin-26 family protein [Mesobacillus selenatarsenatis]|uniref:Uncharacterized protein n=1 Tax=Mesobacillus selenatarsenatis (strain DSM 18680 / JCM 14380 / FERM P-15431 / SF-1) TaxID=1321606 RepID=A0A0A8XBK1_MESS1|nr:geobacillin-26 family protein [Mesobacillus selenatarsenatis]GAM16654.1 hypothetical protein SAMD00020551_4884 [Mesobacillus selenatarsenatis SF-1]